MKQIEEEKLASDSVNCLKQWTKKRPESNGENKMTDESFMWNLAIALKQNNQTVGEKNRRISRHNNNNIVPPISPI